jgi:uncharacterized protein YxeA
LISFDLNGLLRVSGPNPLERLSLLFGGPSFPGDDVARLLYRIITEQQYQKTKGGDIMKKAIVLIVSLLFALSVAGLSFAQEKKEAAPAPVKEEQKMEKHHAKKDRHYVHGEVTAVDAAANTLTVKGKKGEVTLTITDKTRFHREKTLADVKVGDRLTAKYAETDGKMVAKSIKTKKAHHRHHKKEMKQEEKKEEKK